MEDYFELGKQFLESFDKQLGETDLGTLAVLGAGIGVIGYFAYQQLKILNYKRDYKKFIKENYPNKKENGLADKII